MASTKWDDPDRLEGMIFAIDSLPRGAGPCRPSRIEEYQKRLTDIMFHAFLRQKYEQNRDATLDFQLPKSAFMDHIRDCFGWKKPIEKVASPYTRAMITLFKEKTPPRSLFTQQFGRFRRHSAGRAVDIDIIRGGRYER